MTLLYEVEEGQYEYELDFYDLRKAVEKLLRKEIGVKFCENEKVEKLLVYLLKDLDSRVLEEIAESIREDLEELFYNEAQQAYAENLQMKADDLREYYRDKI